MEQCGYDHVPTSSIIYSPEMKCLNSGTPRFYGKCCLVQLTGQKYPMVLFQSQHLDHKDEEREWKLMIKVLTSMSVSLKPVRYFELSMTAFPFCFFIQTKVEKHNSEMKT
jgi:hypothetical protein